MSSQIVFSQPRRRGFFDTLTSKILIVNVIIFFLTLFSQDVFNLLALRPDLAVNQGMIWQFFTYMYVHSTFDPFHIFFNMFALLMFGPTIENLMGKKKYFIFYTLCGIGSALFHILIYGIGSTALVGASGAIFGIVTAYALFFPKNIIYVYFIPMRAIVAVALFASIELIFGLSGAQSGVAHFGHLGGMIVAFILVNFFGYGKREDHVYFWESDW